MVNKNVVSDKRSSQTKCSVRSEQFRSPVRAAMGNVNTSKFTYNMQCWNVKRERRTMSTKSILGASGVGTSTCCKVQSKVQKQEVIVLRYAKQGAVIPLKNQSKKKKLIKKFSKKLISYCIFQYKNVFLYLFASFSYLIRT